MQSQYRRRPSRSSFSSRTSSYINNTSQTKRTPSFEPIPDNTYLYGYGLLLTTFITFFFLIYAIVVSKLLPPSNNKLLDWLRNDEYYCLLLPITAIAWIYWVIWNWMGMKFFRHN
ncbi:phosphatidylinositol N-acetylglucosaminyltransferase subunit Y-domain-containing protein [Sporodiniella umbellata]|nr:phosphatidylinositol N-acetylglucosaminyltransferase subunit Y-domain-containing protein [Sporodiniella umbellata]